MKFLLMILILATVLMACGGEEESRPTASNTPAPSDTPSPTQIVPTDIPPTLISDNPAIELVSAPADSCVNEDETQSTVISFEVIYDRVGTNNYMGIRLEAGDYVYESGSPGEGREGAGGLGFYPTAYDFPPNTPVTLTVTAYLGEDTNSPVSSISSLTYDCTTGETIDKTFERK
jgi:hypothetical protein